MITNVTRKQLLAAETRWCRTPLEKGLGLMFKTVAPAYGVIFPFDSPRRVSIHMFFVFFPLDILWLDDKKQVLYAETLRPFTLREPGCKASFILELPAGVVAASGTKKGDNLVFD